MAMGPIWLPGFYLFLVDRYLRFLQSRRQVCLVSARVLPCDTLELNFSKSHDSSLLAKSNSDANIQSLTSILNSPHVGKSGVYGSYA